MQGVATESLVAFTANGKSAEGRFHVKSNEVLFAYSVIIKLLPVWPILSLVHSSISAICSSQLT